MDVVLLARMIGEGANWLRDRVRRVRGHGDGREEEGEYCDQEAGEPGTSSLPTRGATSKSGNVEDNLHEEDQPEERQQHE
jgi:hypothetical protein